VARSLMVLDGGAGHQAVEWGGTTSAAGAGAKRGGGTAHVDLGVGTQGRERRRRAHGDL
jgi:hypothetical protein